MGPRSSDGTGRSRTFSSATARPSWSVWAAESGSCSWAASSTGSCAQRRTDAASLTPCSSSASPRSRVLLSDLLAHSLKFEYEPLLHDLSRVVRQNMNCRIWRRNALLIWKSQAADAR